MVHAFNSPVERLISKLRSFALVHEGSQLLNVCGVLSVHHGRFPPYGG